MFASLPETLVVKIDRIYESGRIDQMKMRLTKDISILSNIEGQLSLFENQEYELTAFIDIAGSKLNECSYRSVTKLETGRWIVKGPVH